MMEEIQDGDRDEDKDTAEYSNHPLHLISTKLCLSSLFCFMFIPI